MAAKRKAKRRYGKAASKLVESAMRRRKRGTLRSGGSGKKVKSRAQAIAIGLSEAREKGAKVPEPPDRGSKSKRSPKRKRRSSKKSGSSSNGRRSKTSRGNSKKSRNKSDKTRSKRSHGSR